MHVFGDAIVPSSMYQVRVVSEECYTTGDLWCMGPSEEFTTVTWGNTVEPFAGGSQPNFGDVSAIVDAFRAGSNAPSVPRADLVGVGNPGQPNTPNRVVNFGDISAGVDAFRGLAYPYTITSCP